VSGGVEGSLVSPHLPCDNGDLPSLRSRPLQTVHVVGADVVVPQLAQRGIDHFGRVRELAHQYRAYPQQRRQPAEVPLTSRLFRLCRHRRGKAEGDRDIVTFEVPVQLPVAPAGRLDQPRDELVRIHVDLESSSNIHPS
jgi:hypothetical protein